MTAPRAISTSNGLLHLTGRKPFGNFQFSVSNFQFSVQGRSAFTLLEILAVMALLSLILGISVISISGVQDEDRLRRAASMIETTARENLLKALETQQPVIMPLSAGSIGGSDFGTKLEIRRVGEKAFRQPKRGEEWEFSPTGICEPIEVRLTGPGGEVEMAFDALTACAKRKTLDLNAKS